MNEPMISVSGIRGIVNDSFSEKLIRDWARAFGKFCGEKTAVVIGRDTRQSGEWTEKIITGELITLGVEPILLGVATTPTTELAVTHHKAQGGIIITASHNPIEWNGLKFLGSDGVFLNAQEVDELKKIVATKEVETTETEFPDIAVHDTEAIKRHVEKVLTTLPIDIENIRQNKFRVVLDPVNGAGALAVPPLLEKLGCETIIINGEPSGIFGHTPEPRPENLVGLSDKVKETGAAIGFAVDPDADRLALINEKGEAISEEYTLAIAAMAALREFPHFALRAARGRQISNTVAVNLSTSRMIDDVAQMFGGKVLRTAVGEINVVKGMREEKSFIGGEGNGGVIFPKCHEGRDSLVGIALILNLLAKEKCSVSEIVEKIPSYVMEKIKIPVPPNFDPKKFTVQIKKIYTDAKITAIDGIRVDTQDGWVHVRASNTEPIFRIIAEAKTKSALEKIISDTKGLLN